MYPGAIKVLGLRPPPQPLRVLLVDSTRAVRAGMRAALARAPELKG
jgi:hypothetical protein